jgi:N-acetylmuramoyl-L-alanine amidase
VLDVDHLAKYSLFMLYNPVRLIVDCERAPAAAIFSRPVQSPLTKSPDVLRSRPYSSFNPSHAPPIIRGTNIFGSLISTESAATDTVDAKPLQMSVALPPAAPATNARGGFSIARQLGLGASRIAIDPGHGGHDPGAMQSGVNEAEVVLDIALRLEQLLVQQGFEVILTRRGDVYVPLEERTAIANREGADLLLSIHANASGTPNMRGVETYFLNFAVTKDAAALAARENSASGRRMSNLPDLVKAIASSSKRVESRDFAAIVQRALYRQLRTTGMRDLGVKQAPFAVLIGAEMPSILAEVAFLTNRQDQRLLKNSAYRQRIAEALLAGILRYQQTLKATSRLAQQ